MLTQYPALSSLVWSEPMFADAEAGTEDGFKSNGSSFGSFGSCASEAALGYSEVYQSDYGGYKEDMIQSPRFGY